MAGDTMDWAGTMGDKTAMENGMDINANLDTGSKLFQNIGSDSSLLQPYTGTADPVYAGGYTPADTGFNFSDAFKPKNIGGTLQGFAAIAGAAAGAYDTYNRKQYQDKVFKMEENRINRITQRQDKQQANYEKVFG